MSILWFHILQAEALTRFVSKHLFEDVGLMNNLGKQRYCLPQSKEEACLLPMIKDMGLWFRGSSPIAQPIAYSSIHLGSSVRAWGRRNSQ